MDAYPSPGSPLSTLAPLDSTLDVQDGSLVIKADLWSGFSPVSIEADAEEIAILQQASARQETEEKLILLQSQSVNFPKKIRH
jgi:hypothetical protein